MEAVDADVTLMALWPLKSVGGESARCRRINAAMRSVRGHLGANPAVVVRQVGQRLGDVNTRRRCAQRHMGQQLHETELVVDHLDPNASR